MGEDDGVKLFDKTETQSWIETAIELPGAIAVIFFLSLILPIIGFNQEVSWAILLTFSIPTSYAFIMMAILDRHIKFKKHITILVLMSFAIYILTRIPHTPLELYVYIFVFVIGLGISSLAYFVYYSFYRFGRRMFGTNSANYRKRFMFLFIPTFILMVAIIILIGNIPFGEQTISSWVNSLVGGIG